MELHAGRCNGSFSIACHTHVENKKRKTKNIFFRPFFSLLPLLKCLPDARIYRCWWCHFDNHPIASHHKRVVVVMWAVHSVRVGYEHSAYRSQTIFPFIPSQDEEGGLGRWTANTITSTRRLTGHSHVPSLLNTTLLLYVVQAFALIERGKEVAGNHFNNHQK